MLQWLIDAAPSEEKLTIPQLVKHMMRIGNASVLSPAGVSNANPWSRDSLIYLCLLC